MNDFYPNAFFRMCDPADEYLHGFRISEGWWSRRFEYSFVMKYAGAGQIVADMGAGWHYRPLHDALSNVCDFVYAVDYHPGILDEKEIPPMKSGIYINADFTKPIEAMLSETLDRIFCVSVLEECGDYVGALKEFYHLLKPDGLCIITCDMPHRDDKPEHEKYRGLKLENLESAMKEAGFRFQGSINRVRDYIDLLHNDEFNLCVWHCVLKKG